MSHVKVDSSQIHSLDYSPGDEAMSVRFKCRSCAEDKECPKCKGSGYLTEYRYTGVSQEKYLAIRDAKAKEGGSVGSEFHKLVRSKPKEHPYEKVK